MESQAPKHTIIKQNIFNNIDDRILIFSPGFVCAKLKTHSGIKGNTINFKRKMLLGGHSRFGTVGL